MSKPPALHDKALQDLSFIRRTMEGASAFTDVPGWGLVGAGLVAFVTAPLAARQPTPERWLACWLVAAAIASTAGTLAMWRKMRRRALANGGSNPIGTPARRFLLNLVPALAVGALLTLALADVTTPGLEPRIADRVLPGTWLSLYGLGVTTAGAFSIRAVPLMGLGFIILGAAALFIPALDGDLMMALGFGGLQVAFGLLIARRHGG